MKKIILFLLFSFTFSWAMAQSLALYYENVLLSENEGIALSAHPDSGLMVCDHLDVKNISNDSIFVICVRNIIENVENTINTFCWGQCYPPNVDTSTFVRIYADNMTSKFIGDHNPNGEIGVTKVEYTFYDMNNTDDKVSFIVNYDATETNSIENYASLYRISNAYPNPANNFVSLDYELKGDKKAKIAVYNLLGSVVKEIELTESFGTQKINTSDLIEGIYFYSLLINNESISTHKLIIKH